MKKVIYLLLIFIMIGIGLGLLLGKPGNLASSKSVLQETDDFLLHVRVEEEKEGIKVLHSIQYMGEGTIEMMHQEPLISVFLNDGQHQFTGESTTKKMERGAIYPQNEVIFPAQRKGTSDLHIHAQFTLDGEEINIEHVEELVFN